MGVSTLGLSTADWPFVLPSAVFTLCPLATLLFPACAAIGNAMTAAMIRANFKRMDDAPYVSASLCWLKSVGKRGPWEAAAPFRRNAPRRWARWTAGLG